MRTVVLDRDMVEVEIKPQQLQSEYRGLLERDLDKLAAGDLVQSNCPGCVGGDARPAFTRSGFSYLSCDGCRSLYVAPRPGEKALTDFYRHADSAVFWREKLLPATREARRVKVSRPRVEWLLDVVDEYLPDARSAIAVGHHSDLLMEELAAQDGGSFATVVTNPVADVEFADRNFPGVSVRPMPLAEFGVLGPVDVVLAFDILDRCADPDLLFAQASAAMGAGGLLLATTILGSGFDIQVLWDKAEGIYPPERLNLLSVEGLTCLFERHGFEALEFSTPGTFDVETVRQAVNADPGGDWPRFIRYMVEHRDEAAMEGLQEYLQRARLSSFGRIALRKKG
jgi:hypothetical protein